MKSGSQGFSLLELLVVAAILAVLVGLAMPSYTNYIEKSAHAVTAANLKTLKKALMDYHADLGTYPASLAYLARPDADPNFAGRPPIRYLMELPKDPEPQAPSNWGYYVFSSDGSSSYSLAAKYQNF